MVNGQTLLIVGVEYVHSSPVDGYRDGYVGAAARVVSPNGIVGRRRIPNGNS